MNPETNSQSRCAVDALFGVKFTPGWPGLRHAIIPGPDCYRCRNTGYHIMHGAPRRGDGLPIMDNPCQCGRDPIQYLHDEIARKFYSSPNIRDQV